MKSKVHDQMEGIKPDFRQFMYDCTVYIQNLHTYRRHTTLRIYHLLRASDAARGPVTLLPFATLHQPGVCAVLFGLQSVCGCRLHLCRWDPCLDLFAPCRFFFILCTFLTSLGSHPCCHNSVMRASNIFSTDEVFLLYFGERVE
jgi:hypothetical protein